MSDKPRDKIYATPQSMIVDFAFDEKVAGVFPDMIRRSVPGYETVITLLGLLAEQYAQADMHLAFKKANGYSELEISQKRTALENVLIPDSFDVHRQRLQQAGFGQVYQWFQCFNFASLLAIK